MSNISSTPLAEALVRVVLKPDITQNKNEINNVVDNTDKALRKQTGQLKRESREWKVLGNDITDIGKKIMKAFVLPATGLGILGVKQYMQVFNDKGAKDLRNAMWGLGIAWEQFLGRLGKAIYNTEIFRKAIELLRQFLNSIDEKKLMRIFEAVKWAAIVGFTTIMLGSFIKMASAIERIVVAMKWLQTGEIVKFLSTLGGTTAVAESKQLLAQAGGAAVGGAAGGAGSMGILELLKRNANYAMGKGETARFEKLAGEGVNLGKTPAEALVNLKSGGMANTEQGAKDITLVNKELAVDSQAISKFGNGLRLAGEWFLKITRVLFIVEAAFNVLSGLFGEAGVGGSLWEGIKKLGSFILDLITTILTPFSIAMDAIMGGFKVIGATIKFLITGPFVGFGKALNELSDTMDKVIDALIDKIGTTIGNKETPLEENDYFNNLAKERRNKMAFGFPTVATTSFAGLHEAAQSALNSRLDYQNSLEQTRILNEQLAVAKDIRDKQTIEDKKPVEYNSIWDW